jgi:hypothetical protein
MLKKIILIFIILFISNNLFAEVKKHEKKSKKIDVIKFIPGIYQIKSGEILKGGFLLSSFITTITGAILSNSKGNDYYEQYLISTSVEEVIYLRDRTEKKYKNRNYFIAGLFSVWLIHFIDMKFFNNKRGVINSEITKNSINIGFYYFF